MTEKNELTIDSFNNWLVDVAGEAGAWVEHTESGVLFVINDQIKFNASCLHDLIALIDSSGLLGAGLINGMSETFC